MRAFWQAALWWSEYYGEQGTVQDPRGSYFVGQDAAAIVEPD